jgi:hypothetical protein
MGTIQGKFLCSYLYLELAKCHIFCFIFYVFCSTKSENKGTEQIPGESGWHGWEGEGGRERGRRMSMVQTRCTHICKCKNDTCWNCSGNEGRRAWEREVEGVNSSMIYLIHCKNICKCYNVFTPSTTKTQMGKKDVCDLRIILVLDMFPFTIFFPKHLYKLGSIAPILCMRKICLER